ncbi:MAG: TRAP transporter small permease [Clostridiales Family XIII bacterium]|jgi:TRAP-type C4-dicarboxylate transport system permease small subunit|nr:TRAP transporter small permease [Clostridiales Family XIII bacterium]
MAKVKKVIYKASLYLENISLVFLSLTALITVVNVLSRAFFNHPIFGITEGVQYAIFAAVCLGAANCTLLNQHAKVGIIVEALKPKAQKITGVVTHIMSIGFFAVVTVRLWPGMVETFHSTRTTESYAIPYWYINLFIIICFIMVTIVLLYQLVVQIIALTSKEEPEAS